MYKNLLLLAWRNLLKHKVFSIVNIAGLAAGIACVLLLLLYISDELSYDRFHTRADRIYRVVQTQYFTGAAQPLATTSGPVARALEATFPEVEKAVRLFFRKNVVLTFADKQFYGENMAIADAAVFDVFSFKLIRGNPTEALRQPYSLVLTEETAAKFFAGQEAIGKVIKVNGTDYTIRGVMENIPAQSHMHFSCLASISTFESSPWIKDRGITGLWTYVLLKPDTDVQALKSKLPVFTEQYHGKEYVKKIAYDLQALTRIHLYSDMAAEIEPNGNIQYIRIFRATAIAVLLLACINYVSLATARAAERMKEVGLRKTLGAYRWQISLQFLAESLLITCVAAVAAVVLAVLCLPLFNQLAGKALALTGFGLGYLVYGLLIFVCVGIGAGAYPAWYLSGFQPTRVSPGNRYLHSRGNLRKLLVVAQFAVSVIILVATITAFKQLAYIRESHLGFNKENLLHIKVRNRAQWRGKTELLKQEFLRIPSVRAATASLNFMGEELDASDVRLAHAPAGNNHLLSVAVVDYDYIETMQLQMVAGRAFSRAYATDTSAAFIINEAAVRQFGWHRAAEAIGQKLEYLGGGRTTEPIIGVVKDFHFASLHQQVQPLIIMCWPSMLSSVSVRIQAGNMAKTLASIAHTWRALSPDFPFEYEFADEALAKHYKQDETAGRLFSLFAIVAISIACMGLFGLASFTTVRRTKEIGIRKVLGAGTYTVVWLLIREFLGLSLLAILVACPLAYYAVYVWLQNFAYHVPVNIPAFIYAGSGVLLVTIITVSYQSIKAALANPVNSLRSE
jgi:putative ABC transport system permease protein